MCKYTEEEILDEFKKIGYVNVIKEDQTITLHNPTKSRTIYINEDNSFSVVIGPPHLVGFLRLMIIDFPTIKEKHLIKKLIKLRKEK